MRGFSEVSVEERNYCYHYLPLLKNRVMNLLKLFFHLPNVRTSIPLLEMEKLRQEVFVNFQDALC